MIARLHNWLGRAMLLAASLLFIGGSGPLQAAQQFQGLCSYVKIEILQELALERIGFLATLEITNNEGDASITDFSSALTFQKRRLNLTDPAEDASDLFFVQPPTLSGIDAVDGTGIIRPGETAVISWFIIPKISAGGEAASGIQYDIGANLGGSIYGQEIDPIVLTVIPDTITVKPEPQLEITYFQPRDVDGDDPFTPDVVEAPIPFTLGVLVKNSGFGPAKKLTIKSEQPRIVENLQGLLVVPRLLGSRVDDDPTDYASLTVDLGDIQPGKCRKGAWDMITTLSGEFTEFRASYTHATELGGRDTSVIKSLDAHFINHEVLNDQPGRDDLLDFLADTIDDPNREIIPDTLYESDCNTLPVNQLLDVEVLSYDPVALTAQVRATADFENWVYIRADDPAQAKLKIASVVRSDGKILNENNYWTHIRYRKPDNAKLTWLNIFDFVALGDYTYTVTYDPPAADIAPPQTVLRFNGEVQEKDGKYYVLRDTQMYFTVEDDSPVGTYYRLDGAVDFLPAYPFTLLGAGEHLIEFYSEDAAGNEEAHQTATLVLSDDFPSVTNLGVDSEDLFIAGDALSVRPTAATVGFQGVVTATRLDGVADVFRGVYGYPTLSGLPASPTAASDATLTVGGEQVDFYRYRVNGGAWSSEAAISEPLQLTGLSGSVLLEVLGRSQHGGYPADDQALGANWQIDAGTQLSITGIPETPGQAADATLTVVGSDFYCYRLDGTFYQPNLLAGEPILLQNLTDGAHQLDVTARANAGEICPTTAPGDVVASWTLDRNYGYQLPAAEQVRHEDLGQVDDLPSNFSWDGRNDSGVVVPPDWYSVRITLTDGLGRSSYGIQPVQVGDMLSDGTGLSDAGGAGQLHARAFGEWAVWQDQRAGNWDIWAQRLSDPLATAFAVTGELLNQEKPSTDGRFAVWQDRQADGTWDIWARDLETGAPAFAITTTPAFDEQKPVVDWPWVVFQRKPVADPNAPWQLHSFNMETAQERQVDATTQDQLDPAVHRGRLVWQDFRDVGFGEIYLQDLRSEAVTRITDNTGGQYHPAIYDQWVVWSDNRQGLQLDLYGYNLWRGAEVQLTDTAEDENRPSLNGLWVVYEEDAAGQQQINLRLLHLENAASVQLTNAPSVKEQPVQASDRLLWVDQAAGHGKVMAAALPDLQPVFNNRNTVAVTQGMVDYLGDAHSLLRLWNTQAGVTEITRYTSLLPTPVAETVTWDGAAPVGPNFALQTGAFLWVRFDGTEILELGRGQCQPLDLTAGINVFSYSCFPDQYTAYALIEELGTDQVIALRVLDAATGQWRVANVSGGSIVGEDFRIPTIAVVLLELQSAQTGWTPGGP